MFDFFFFFLGGGDFFYSTVLYSTVQYSTVQYSTVQYSTVGVGCIQSFYSTVQYSTVQYSTVTVQYRTQYSSRSMMHSSFSFSTWTGHLCSAPSWRCERRRRRRGGGRGGEKVHLKTWIKIARNKDQPQSTILFLAISDHLSLFPSLCYYSMR